MVRSRGYVWWFATRANLDSDHGSAPHRRRSEHLWGKGLKGVTLRASLRATPRPRLLHHARGRQLRYLEESWMDIRPLSMRKSMAKTGTWMIL
jgi:hypothetical protein